MKKNILLLVLILGLLAISCSLDLNKDLIGSWKSLDGKIILTFSESKILKITYPNDPSTVVVYKYEVEKGVITLDNGLFKMPYGYSISGNVLTLAGDKYIRM